MNIIDVLRKSELAHGLNDSEIEDLGEFFIANMLEKMK